MVCLILHPLWCYIFFIYLQLSIIGLGIAYGISSLIMLIATFAYAKIKNLEVAVSYKEITWQECKIFLKMALECGILSSIDTLGFEIISFISSFLPQTELDANICVINIYNNIYSISLGFSTALTTLVGNYMGENKHKTALKYSKLGILINFVLTVGISLCCIFFHSYIAMLYINDRRILSISSKLTRIVGIYIIFDALQLQMCGIIRGIGKQFIGMCIGVIIFIFLQTGVVLVFVHVANLGIYGIWWGQMICVFLAAIVYFLVLKNSDWEKLANEASQEIKDQEEIGEHFKSQERVSIPKGIFLNENHTDNNIFSDTTCP